MLLHGPPGLGKTSLAMIIASEMGAAIRVTSGPALERAGVVTGVITQNVDGLHQAAGTRDVVELHGNLVEVVCLTCEAREDRRTLDARMARDNPGFDVDSDEIMFYVDGDYEARKGSGIGREFGSAFIDDYTELKSVMVRY